MTKVTINTDGIFKGTAYITEEGIFLTKTTFELTLNTTKISLEDAKRLIEGKKPWLTGDTWETYKIEG